MKGSGKMLEKLYKLTNQQMRSYGDCKWAIGEEKKAPGGGELCSAAYLHAYRDPILAMMMNPSHADINSPRCFDAEGEVEKDDGTKVGCTSLTLVKEIPVPVISSVRRVAFGILAAKAVYTNPDWTRWADAWLDGSDRTTLAARAARWAAKACTPGRTLDLVMIAASAMCLPIRD